MEDAPYSPHSYSTVLSQAKKKTTNFWSADRNSAEEEEEQGEATGEDYVSFDEIQFENLILKCAFSLIREVFL